MSPESCFEFTTERRRSRFDLATMAVRVEAATRGSGRFLLPCLGTRPLRRLVLVGLLLALIMPGARRARAAAAQLTTPLSAFDLDPSQFREWDGVVEKPPLGGHGPEWVVWTQQSAPGQSSGNPGVTGLNYGFSKIPGWRQLRVGFTRPIQVGSVLVRGGGQLSALKPEAPYPGNLGDDTHWIRAERLLDGVVTREPVRDHEYAVWVLPPGTTTRALRFSHFSPATDPIYVGYLAGVYVLSERVLNLAPQAKAVGSTRSELASLVNDEHGDHHLNGPTLWENGESGAPPRTGGPTVVSEAQPEFLILNWPSEVTLSGIALPGQAIAGAGFGRAKVQRFTGDASARPAEAPQSSWETVLDIANDPLSPQLNVAEFDWFAFPAGVATRALRLLITQPADTTGSDPGGIEPFVRGGKRVWLEEWLALVSLGERPLEAAVVPRPSTSQPPIPVTFTLEKPGLVTLVIEDATGRRVRNLVSETPFSAGTNTVWWDGCDDQAIMALGPGDKKLLFDPQGLSSLPGSSGLNRVRPKLVEPGTYSVRGLVRDPLDLVYEFSIYSPGNPPWTTFDRTGQPYRYFLNLERYLTPEIGALVDRSFGWLAEHTPPSDALFLPGDDPRILLSSHLTEAGNALAWVNLDGMKVHGQRTIGGFWTEAGFVEQGSWTGAAALARDTGPLADPGVEAYSGSPLGTDLILHRLGPSGTISMVLSHPLGAADDRALGGLAAHNGRLVASLRTLDQLLFVNAADGNVLGVGALADPRGLAFDAAGRLLVLAGDRLLRFRLAAEGVSLSEPEELAVGLDDPRRLAFDGSGNIYISLHGQSHQVRVLSPEGGVLRTIGIAGLPSQGPYNPQRMQHPLGLTVTPDNRLWVAESDHAPKRISVWTTDGAFVKAIYGGPQYGGGGELDPLDRTRFYYYDRGGMEFRIDWETGISELVNIYHRAGPGDLRLPLEESFWYRGPQTPIPFNGHHYMVADNENPGGGSRAVSVWRMEQGRTYPVATMSVVRALVQDTVPIWPILTNETFAPLIPEPPALVAWSDLNDNHQVEPDELQFGRDGPGSLSINERLEISTSNFKLFKPVRFTPAGAPVFDLAAGQTLLADPPDDARYTAEQTVHRPDAWTIKPAGGAIRGVRDGALRWTYPNEWGTLQATVNHPAPKRSRPGQVFGTMRMLGLPVVPSAGEAGEVFGVYGYYGNIYLFSTDGLFLATLFQDERDAPGWMMPQLPRGTSLNDISLHDEAFWPSMSKTSDGRIYLTVGKQHSSIVRIDGLESVRRIALPNLVVGADDLERAANHFDSLEHARLQAHGRSRLAVGYRPLPPMVDGELGDWSDAAWARIDENSKAAVRLAGGRLFLAFDIEGTGAIRNIGEPSTALFAAGGGLDLFLGTDGQADPARTEPVAGDLRLLVTLHHGVAKAFVYQSTAADQRHALDVNSSWRTTRFDRVQEVSSSLEFGQSGAGYEIGIPLAVLGWQPVAGSTYLGDIGVIRGRNGQSALKAYWNNKGPNVHLDAAGEATLRPHLWGIWEIAADFPAEGASENLAPMLPSVPDLAATEGIPLVVNLSDRHGLWYQLIPNVWGTPGWPQNVDYLTNHPSFTEYGDGVTVLMQGFDVPGTTGPTDRHNHAQRVWGWLEPPMDGDYVFWMTSGGWGAEGISEGVLFLGTNEHPSSKRPIASNLVSPPGVWDASPSQRSAPVTLLAGRRYYIEALHNEQLGPAHLSVGWTLPDGWIERPMPTRHFRLDPVPIDRIDLDWPPQALSYTVQTEAGASVAVQVDSGILTWTPEEEFGGHTVDITVQVTDRGSPPRSASTSFRVLVTEDNRAPQLAPIPDAEIDEGTEWTFTATATDADLPPQKLAFSIAPPGLAHAQIDADSGLFRFTPSENQGPGTHGVTLRVHDDAVDRLVDEKTFTISIREVNTAPRLNEIAEQSVEVGRKLAFDVAATDDDVPANRLRFLLGEDAPDGATITEQGHFTWTPTAASGGAVHTLTVRVEDDGTPVLSDTRAVQIRVQAVMREIRLAEVKLSDDGMLSFSWGAEPGRMYLVQFKADLGDPVWTNILPPVSATKDTASFSVAVGEASQRFFRVIAN